MATLSAATLEAIARTDNATIQLVGVMFSNAVFPNGYLTYIGYDYDVTINGIGYVGIGMDVQMPPLGTEPANDDCSR